MSRRKLHDHYEFVRGHVGQIVTYLENHSEQSGEVERVTMDISIESVFVWLKQNPFPKKIGSDQIRICSCQTGSTTER